MNIPQPDTEVLFLRAHFEMCSTQFYASALQPKTLASQNPCKPPIIQAILQDTLHRILRGIRGAGDEPDSQRIISGGRGYKRAPILGRCLLRAQKIEETHRGHASNKLLMAILCQWTHLSS